MKADRREIVAPWLTWATFAVSRANGLEVAAAGCAARDACAELWRGPA